MIPFTIVSAMSKGYGEICIGGACDDDRVLESSQA